MGRSVAWMHTSFDRFGGLFCGHVGAEVGAGIFYQVGIIYLLITIAQDLWKGAIPNTGPLGKGQGRKEVP